MSERELLIEALRLIKRGIFPGIGKTRDEFVQRAEAALSEPPKTVRELESQFVAWYNTNIERKR